MTIASTIAPSTGLKHGPSSHPRATSRRATPVAHASLSRRASLLALTTATTTALSTANPTPASASVVHVNIPVAELSPLQLTAQRNAYQAQAETVLRAKLTADDLGPAFRLLFRDAADFDAPNQAGGLDGSVVSSPGADLKGIVATLTDAKKEIDGQAGAAGPISWSDLMCLAVKVRMVVVIVLVLVVMVATHSHSRSSFVFVRRRISCRRRIDGSTERRTRLRAENSRDRCRSRSNPTYLLLPTPGATTPYITYFHPRPSLGGV